MKTMRMASIRSLALISVLAATSAQAAGAQCLNRQERRDVMVSGKVVPLAEALRAVQPPRGEVLRARLCRGGDGFVYLLTLLSRDGKVTQVTVDAVSGRLAGH